MPSKDPLLRFEDILENIVRIEEFTAGMDLQTFTEDGLKYVLSLASG